MKRATVVVGLLLAAISLASWALSPRRGVRRSAERTPATRGIVPEGEPGRPDFCEPTEHAPRAQPLHRLIEASRLELLDRIRYIRHQPQEVSAELLEGVRLVASRDGNHDRGVQLLAAAPDGAPDGFALAPAAALWLSARAARDDTQLARDWIDRATSLAPDSALPPLQRYLLATRQRDQPARRDALTGAFERAPDEPAVALALARMTENEDDPRTALEAFDAYLAQIPDDIAVQRMRQRLSHRTRVLRDHITLRRDGLTLRYPPSLSAQQQRGTHRLIGRALQRAAQLLRCDVRPTLTTVVYESRQQMLDATCGPAWTGARFDGQLHIPARALSRPRLLEHEVLHAQLHSCVPRAPMWFNEGLAQVFARQDQPDRRKHIRTLVDNRTWIPFASLQGSISEIGDSPEARLSYFQSRAMVEWLMEQRGEDVIAEAVRLLAGGTAPEDLLPELTTPPLDGPRLLQWLAKRR